MGVLALRNFLESRLWCHYWRETVIPLKLLVVYPKQNGEKFSDLGDWSLKRHTFALTECTDRRRIHVTPVLRSAKRVPANVRRLNNISDVVFYCSVGERSRALALLNASWFKNENNKHAGNSKHI